MEYEIKFNGICLKQDSEPFLHKNIVNLYITYKLDVWPNDLNTDFTVTKLTKNADPDKYKCSGYGIGFDSRSEFAWTDESVGKNFIILGVDNSSSVHIDGRNKNILVFGEGLTKGLDNVTIRAEAKYPIPFTESGKRFELSRHYNGSNSFIFDNAVKMYQFNAKD